MSEVSDRRREGRWCARRAHQLPPGVVRRSGAALRSTDFVRRPPRRVEILRDHLTRPTSSAQQQSHGVALKAGGRDVELAIPVDVAHGEAVSA